MAILDIRMLRALWTLLVFGLALCFVYLAWRTLLVFLFAILFAYLLEPLVARVQRFGLRRTAAVAIVYVALLAALGILVFDLGPRVVGQAGKLGQSLAGLSQPTPNAQIARPGGGNGSWTEQVPYRVRQFLADHPQDLLQWEERGVGELGTVAQYLTWLAAIPILAAFFLVGGRQFAVTALAQFLRRSDRQEVQSLLEGVHEVLSRYIRAQVTLAAFATLFYLVLFASLRLPFAMALAAVAGPLEFIPVAGPFAAAAIVVGTGLLLNYPHLWLLIAALCAWRLAQDYLISPRIMGGGLHLHPLAVLFGILAGGEIGGIIGVYLSVPAMAILGFLWRHWRTAEADRPPGELAASAGGPASGA